MPKHVAIHELPLKDARQLLTELVHVCAGTPGTDGLEHLRTSEDYLRTVMHAAANELHTVQAAISAKLNESRSIVPRSLT